MKLACRVGLEECLQEVVTRFKTWISDVNNVPKPHPDIRSLVYGYGKLIVLLYNKVGNNLYEKVKTWKYLGSLLANENSSYEVILNASNLAWLANARNFKLLYSQR